MLISALLAFAAEKVISFTLPAFFKFFVGTIITSGATTGIGVYLYTRKSDSTNDTIKALELAELQSARELRRLNTQKEAEALVLNSAFDASMIVANTRQQQSLITSATVSLARETQVAEEVNLQMLDASALLALLGESISHESMPIIEALRCRIEALSATTELLDVSSEKLQQLELLLQDTVVKHSALQEKFANDIVESQKKRDCILEHLDECFTLVGDLDNSHGSADLFARARAYIERLYAKVAALEASLHESSAKLAMAIRVNRALKEENSVLTTTILKLSEVENGPTETNQLQPRWNGARLFS